MLSKKIHSLLKKMCLTCRPFPELAISRSIKDRASFHEVAW